MSEPTSALYARTGVCPACGGEGSWPEIKTGMYAEEGREADQHIVHYRWVRPDVPPLHPPFYALASCAKCGYTDFKEEFFEPARSREGRAGLLAPRLKTETSRRGSAIAALRQSGRPGPLDFPGALRLHLLAIAIQELMPEDRRDHLRLARFYLRTAWLFREQGGAGQPTVAEDARLAALDQCAAALRDLRGASERLTSAVAGAPGAPAAADFVRHLEAFGQRYLDLRTRLLDHGTVGGARPAPLAFLLQVRADWPAVPATEAACLGAAVQAFERVYQQGEGDSVALLKLMIELNYRLGRIDRVLEYAASMSKTGQEERLRLQRQLDTDRALTPEERTKLTVRINRLSATLQVAAEIRKDALGRQQAA